MSVLLETSKGDLVVDLFAEEAPRASINFLKLCKIKYYNNCLFHNIQRDFIAQTGDPSGTGKGGESISGLLYGDQARFFDDEFHPKLRHKKRGMLGMAGAGENCNASQFYITTGEDLDSLDEKHTIFGEVTEGLDVLTAINEAFVDAEGRPLQNVRIRHTIILDDPFPDPAQLADHIPDASPVPVFAEGDRLEDDWVPTEDDRNQDVIAEEIRRKEAQNRAQVLEMIGDLPEADAKPPPNMIFVCKLNPVTTEEDLEIIFGRFGNITSCDIIRDYKTGDSLNYAFLGFDTDAAAEEAFFKMDNVLIDDRRIHVDFSQSMHHLWKSFKKFGKAGDAEQGRLADAHQRPAKPGLELKPNAGGFNTGPYNNNGGRYDLLLEEAPEPSGRNNGLPRGRAREEQQRHRHGGGERQRGHRQGDDGREQGRHREERSRQAGDGRHREGRGEPRSSSKRSHRDRSSDGRREYEHKKERRRHD